MNEQYLTINNKKIFKKKYFKYKKQNKNSDTKKLSSSNMLPYSTKDTSFNICNNTHNNFNTINWSILHKDPIMPNQNIYGNKMAINNRRRNTADAFEEINKKINILKIDQKRRDKSLAKFSSTKFYKPKSNIVNYFRNNIKRTYSQTKLINKTVKSMKSNIKYKSYINQDSKIECLKAKIHTLLNDYDKTIIPNVLSTNNSIKSYKVFGNNNKKKEYNKLLLLNNNNNDIKKFNILATSKVFDLNDIKSFNKKINVFFEYNNAFNRNYSQKINNNKYFNTIKIKKIINSSLL